MLGSGNLGLIYLMEARHRLTLEELDERHPKLIGRSEPIRTSGGCWSARPSRGRSSLGAEGSHRLADGRIEGSDPLGGFSSGAPGHLLRTDGFANVADIMVGCSTIPRSTRDAPSRS